MISDREFASSFSSFWRTVAPTTESFVRGLNLGGCQRFAKPFAGSSAPKRRALVNEIAYRYLFSAFRNRVAVARIAHSAEMTTLAIREAIGRIARFASQDSAPADPPSSSEIAEAVGLAQRLEAYFGNRQGATLLDPSFLGCGILTECQGDAVSHGILFEIKAVDRPFRSIEIRQLVIYCALNSVVATQTISGVGLLNPRTGLALEMSVTDFSFEVSGKQPAVLFGEVIEFLSSAGLSA
jgi:hypothetical protein